MAELQKLRFLDEEGREIPDPNPISIPAGFRVPETLEQRIARLIRKDISAQADMQGMETFEEAEDFDIDDDMFDPSSPYEEVFDPVLGRGITLEEFNKNEAIYRERYMQAEQKAHAEMVKSEALRAKVRKAVDPAPVPAEQSGAKRAQVSSDPPEGA